MAQHVAHLVQAVRAMDPQLATARALFVLENQHSHYTTREVYDRLRPALAERRIGNFEVLDIEQALHEVAHPTTTNPAAQHARQQFADIAPRIPLADADGIERIGSPTIAKTKRVMLDLWKKAISQRRVFVHERMIGMFHRR